jgi:hypothetical protein
MFPKSPVFKTSPLFRSGLFAGGAGGATSQQGAASPGRASSAPPAVEARGRPAVLKLAASGAATGAAVWAGAVSPAKPRGVNSQRPAVAGPFDGGGALPRGADDLRAFMSARGNEATMAKHVAEVQHQLVVYEARCAILAVPPYPVNPDAFLLHLEQKACQNGSATSVRNWASNILSFLDRTQRCRPMGDEEKRILEVGLVRLEKTYGVYHTKPVAVTWQGLKDAVDGTAAQGAPLTRRLRITAMHASIVGACGLRPNKHLRSGGKEPIAVKHVLFHPRTKELPFGALEIRVKGRKAAVATGVDKDEFHSVWAEPPCEELDFVSQLMAYIAEHAMGPDEPVFASMDANGYRKQVGHDTGRVCVAIHPREYNANFKELMARAGVTNASARSTRRGFATTLAEEGATDLVAAARMDHGPRKRKRNESSTVGYVQDGLKMLTASRPLRPRTAGPPPQEAPQEAPQ